MTLTILLFACGQREAAKSKSAAEPNTHKCKRPPPRPKSAPASSPLRPRKPLPPSSNDPTPDHTFRPRINPTIPDFAASHMHFSCLLARSRKSHAPPTLRPFRGVELRQRVFEERKKRTLARVMHELNKDVRASPRVGKAWSDAAKEREVGPTPKTTRATELTLAARRAKEEARAKRAEDERLAQAHRAAKEAAMAAVIREAMDSSAHKRMIKGAATGKQQDHEQGVRARRQMARATREYATFLEAMEARLSARPLTLEQVGGTEGPSLREQAKRVAEESMFKFLSTGLWQQVS
ncbi:hypothetical protein BCR44DRAFT_363811 [Catenaria anguillulae PL171]|uniref:Uncharacterized protein n=1 Tax=Catenaria anguillulae PL171 TaxID=765915 RepID=A0A1Y2HEF4_9FUNG|nr:hypothetical protein BCR44DRAFT_363811 [Catenaria anguillulae PL171]